MLVKEVQDIQQEAADLFGQSLSLTWTGPGGLSQEESVNIKDGSHATPPQA